MSGALYRAVASRRFFAAISTFSASPIAMFGATAATVFHAAAF